MTREEASRNQSTCSRKEEAMIFRLGELFCGPGGLAWGATHADIGDPDYGIVHAWANDYDETPAERIAGTSARTPRPACSMPMSENLT